MLEAKLIVGATLHVCKSLNLGRDAGGFARCLRKAKIEHRDGYRCLELYTFFAAHCASENYPSFLARFSIEAAQTLARKSTPKQIQEHFLAKAKAGEDVTYSVVKRAITAAKTPTLPSPNANGKPWLDDNYRSSGVAIHCLIDKPVTAEQLKRIVTAAFNAWHRKLAALPASDSSEVAS